MLVLNAFGNIIRVALLVSYFRKGKTHTKLYGNPHTTKIGQGLLVTVVDGVWFLDVMCDSPTSQFVSSSGGDSSSLVKCTKSCNLQDMRVYFTCTFLLTDWQDPDPPGASVGDARGCGIMAVGIPPSYHDISSSWGNKISCGAFTHTDHVNAKAITSCHMSNTRVGTCVKTSSILTRGFLFPEVSPQNYDANDAKTKWHREAGPVPSRGSHKAEMNILFIDRCGCIRLLSVIGTC